MQLTARNSGHQQAKEQAKCDSKIIVAAEKNSPQMNAALIFHHLTFLLVDASRQAKDISFTISVVASAAEDKLCSRWEYWV